MSGPMAKAKLLGEILIERGDCSPDQVEKALASQAQHGGRVGEVLMAMGVIDQEQVSTTPRDTCSHSSCEV